MCTDEESELASLVKDDSSGRLAAGLKVLKDIGGDGFAAPIAALANVSEDLARLTIAFPYGEVLARPGLELRERQIITASILLAHGSAQSQLGFHLNGLLNVGGSHDDVVSLLYLSAGVLGFPAAINAVPIARATLAQHNISRECGSETAQSAMHYSDQEGRAELEAVSPDFLKWKSQVFWHDLLGRCRLGGRLLHIAAAAMLATQAKHPQGLEHHLRLALASGATQSDIEELLIHVSVYAGFPSALTAATVFSKVLAEPIRAFDEQPLATESRDDTERFSRGAETLAATSGGSGSEVVDTFADVAPELGRLIVAHCYGDVFSRQGLDPVTRELTAIAALTGMATVTAERPLRVHVDAALNLGVDPERIIEAILNVLPYAGFPAIEKALNIARVSFNRR